MIPRWTIDAPAVRARYCQCAHDRDAHQHYRGGRDCALCDCAGYQLPGRGMPGEEVTPARATFRDDLAESWQSGLIVVGGLFLALLAAGYLDVTHWLGGLLLAASQGGAR